MKENYMSRLSEECAEVIQMVSKIKRFGIGGLHPKRKKEGTNKVRLEREIGDVLAVIKMLQDENMIDIEHVLNHAEKKYTETKDIQ